MAIHGHTTIELTDVNTGEVEKYEDDNIITDAVKDLVITPSGDIGLYMFTTRNNQGWVSIQKLNLHPSRIFGGLFCFQNRIEENAENYGYPSDNILIAHAMPKSHDGDDVTMGNYGVTESAILENGVRFVWNFSETQGNGEISAVCLTNPIGGLIGVGNAGTSLTSADTDGDYYCMENGVRFFAEQYQTFGMLDLFTAYRSANNADRQCTLQYDQVSSFNGVYYADGENECVYILSRGKYAFTKESSYNMGEYLPDCNYIRLSKFRMPTQYVRLLEGPVYKYLGDVIIPVPTDFFETTPGNYVYGFHWSSERFIYILMRETSIIKPGETFKILKVCVDDFENPEVISLTNNTESHFYLSHAVSGLSGNHSYRPFGEPDGVGVGDYLFLRANDSPRNLYAINMKTGYVTNLGIFTTAYHQFHSVIDNNSICIYAKEDNATKIKAFIINVNDMTPRQLSGVGCPFSGFMSENNVYCSAIPIWYKNKRVHSYFINDMNNEFVRGMCSDVSHDNLYSYLETLTNSASYSMTRVRPATRNLFTINNLSSPVQKTPDKTMKITYTLYADGSV